VCRGTVLQLLFQIIFIFKVDVLFLHPSWYINVDKVTIVGTGSSTVDRDHQKCTLVRSPYFSPFVLQHSWQQAGNSCCSKSVLRAHSSFCVCDEY
jgi:hypothetical protein